MAFLKCGLNQTSSSCWVFRIPVWSGVRWSTFESVHTQTVVNLPLAGKAMGLIDLTFPMSEDDKSIWPGNHPFRYFWTKWTKRYEEKKQIGKPRLVRGQTTLWTVSLPMWVPVSFACNWNSKTLRYFKKHSISSLWLIIVIDLTQYNFLMRGMLSYWQFFFNLVQHINGRYIVTSLT